MKTFLNTIKGNNNWYNYLIAPIFIFLLTFAFSIPIFIFKTEPNTYQNYFQFLFPSAIMVISIFIVFKWIHKRIGTTLINSTNIRWSRLFWAMGTFGFIMLIIEAVSFGIDSTQYEFSFDNKIFFQYFIISCVLIPFQAAGEEMLMRGYFLQGISWATKLPWLSVLITSILFGLIHLGNPEIKSFGYIFIINYILMGIMAGILTLMDDGTELSIGLHIVNNLYSAIIIGYPSSAFQTNTVLKMKNYDAFFCFIIMLISYIIFLIICYKKYKWDSYKSFFAKLKY